MSRSGRIDWQRWSTVRWKHTTGSDPDVWSCSKQKCQTCGLTPVWNEEGWFLITDCVIMFPPAGGALSSAAVRAGGEWCRQLTAPYSDWTTPASRWGAIGCFRCQWHKPSEDFINWSWVWFSIYLSDPPVCRCAVTLWPVMLSVSAGVCLLWCKEQRFYGRHTATAYRAEKKNYNNTWVTSDEHSNDAYR